MTAFASGLPTAGFGCYSTPIATSARSRGKRVKCLSANDNTTVAALSETSLRNVYVLLRHGESKPNVSGTIISKPSAGFLLEHGLTHRGRSQAQRSAQDLEALMKKEKLERILMLSSDFSRAFETACAVRDELPRAEVRVDIRLRERFFGSYEGQTNAMYEKVWRGDVLRDGSNEAAGVESVFSVRGRVIQCVREQEVLARASGRRLVVLASHGDALQIAETYFRKLCPTQHRELPHLGNCEPRLLSPRHSSLL